MPHTSQSGQMAKSRIQIGAAFVFVGIGVLPEVPCDLSLGPVGVQGRPFDVSQQLYWWKHDASCLAGAVRTGVIFHPKSVPLSRQRQALSECRTIVIQTKCYSCGFAGSPTRVGAPPQ